MRHKAKMIFYVVFGLSIVAVYVLYGRWTKERDMRRTAEMNVSALASDMENYRTEKGELVTKIQGLELNAGNFRQVQAKLYDEVRTLKLKLKDALSVTEVETEDKFLNPDTIYLTVKNDTASVFEYSDNWRHIRAEITGNKINPGNLVTQMRDTLYSVPAITYKGWWFWKRPARIDVHFKNKNPNVSITGGRFIYLSGKKAK